MLTTRKKDSLKKYSSGQGFDADPLIVIDRDHLHKVFLELHVSPSPFVLFSRFLPSQVRGLHRSPRWFSRNSRY